MTTSVTIPSSVSRHHSTSVSSSSPNHSNTMTSTPPVQSVVRKKRTFDIAFLTGQSEKEISQNNNSSEENPTLSLQSHNVHHHHHLHHSNSPSPPPSSRSLAVTTAHSISNNNNVIERKFSAVFHPFASPSSVPSSSEELLLQEQDGTNSDTSSIDVMTNGSLSESESQSHSPLSSISEQPSPPLHPVVLIHHQQHQLSRSNGAVPSSNDGRGSQINVRKNAAAGHHHSHHHHNHHQHNIKSNGGNKTRNNRSPVKDEIRFESRRTIDINHGSDSLKIKENLQFSSSIGLNLSSSNNSSGGGNAGDSPTAANKGGISSTAATDLTIPHSLASTIALLPHVAARFPLGLGPAGMFPGGGHPPPPHVMAAAAAAAAAATGNIPFHAKMEKSESINISYPKVRGGSTGGTPFPDPYAAAAFAAAGGYPYPNILAGLAHHQHHGPPHHHHPFPSHPLGSPPRAPGGVNGGGGASNPAGNGQVSPQSSQPSQHSPNSGASVSPCGLSPSATLLPPSLTSLTLPAQNVCAKCNIGFRMTSDLVYHMRSHHKRDADPVKRQREEKLKCPVCHETFRERHHLTRHMTAHQDRAEEET